MELEYSKKFNFQLKSLKIIATMLNILEVKKEILTGNNLGAIATSSQITALSIISSNEKISQKISSRRRKNNGK